MYNRLPKIFLSGIIITTGLHLVRIHPLQVSIIHRTYEFIATRGVSEDLAEHNGMTRLLNIISFITSLGALGIFVFAVVFTTDYVYVAASATVFIVYFAMIIMHHFGKLDQAKIYFSSVIPLWYGSLMISIGGHFSQSICAASTIVVTYLLSLIHI